MQKFLIFILMYPLFSINASDAKSKRWYLMGGAGTSISFSSFGISAVTRTVRVGRNVSLLDKDSIRLDLLPNLGWGYMQMSDSRTTPTALKMTTQFGFMEAYLSLKLFFLYLECGAAYSFKNIYAENPFSDASPPYGDRRFVQRQILRGIRIMFGTDNFQLGFIGSAIDWIAIGARYYFL
jgi:hypothetical protein